MYSSRLYAKNPVFEFVHEESVKVYLHMLFVVVVFVTLADPLRIQRWSQDRRNQTKSNRESEISNGNIQQNSLCAESCVTKEFHISSRFSPAFFYRAAMC